MKFRQVLESYGLKWERTEAYALNPGVDELDIALHNTVLTYFRGDWPQSEATENIFSNFLWNSGSLVIQDEMLFSQKIGVSFDEAFLLKTFQRNCGIYPVVRSKKYQRLLANQEPTFLTFEVKDDFVGIVLLGKMIDEEMETNQELQTKGLTAREKTEYELISAFNPQEAKEKRKLQIENSIRKAVDKVNCSKAFVEMDKELMQAMSEYILLKRKKFL